MRFSRIFFFLALLSLPIQLNKYFFLSSSYVLGIPIDYRAISVYFSDITIFLFIVSFIFDRNRELPKFFSSNKHVIYAFLLFNIYLLFDALITASSPGPAFYFSLKFLELSLFCLATTLMLQDTRNQKNIQKILIFSLFWQALILISQFLKQGSLGLTFLGERSFTSGTVSIAHLNVFGSLLLRPYGTFPHPNVAAAFLFIYLLLLYILTSTRFFKKHFLIFVPITLALLLTFSRTVFIAAYLTLLNFKRKPILLLLGFFALLAIIYWLVNLPDLQVASISERLVLLQAALDIAIKNVFFGLGSGNFIAELGKLNLFTLTQIRLLQPVHNVFFLILAENGLFGLLLFSYLLFAIAKFATTPAKVGLFISLLVLSSLDHFFWTLQQGQLLLFLSIAFIIAKPEAKKHI